MIFEHWSSCSFEDCGRLPLYNPWRGCQTSLSLKITHLCGVRSDLKCAHPHAFRLFVLDCFLHLCTCCHRLCIGGSSKQIMSCNEDIWVVYLNGFVDVLVICDSVTHGFIKNKDITDIRNTQFNVFNGKHGLQNLLVVSAHKFWVEMQILFQVIIQWTVEARAALFIPSWCIPHTSVCAL